MGNVGGKKKGPKNPEKMYTMLRVLGKGAFGKVNAIERKDTKQLYALKTMSKKEILAKGDTVVQLVLQERRLLSELNNPFLVNLHYAFQNETDLLLVMDICLGGDLLYWRQTKGPFRQHHVKFYAVCLYYALEYLHAKRIIHRDIKPANILLDDRGYAHLMDFGLSTYVPEDEQTRLTGMAGTRQFIAPEIYETVKNYRKLARDDADDETDDDDDDDDASDGNDDPEAEGSEVGTEAITKTTKGKYGYRCEADLFSLGVTLFMLYSDERLYGDTNGKNELAKAILTYNIKFPEHIVERAPMHDFLKRLLCPREERMTLQDIREHEWLADMPWLEIKNGLFQPAFKPPLDRANCDANFELQSQLDHFAMGRAAEKKKRRIDPELQHKFAEWDWRLEFAIGALPPALERAKRERSVSTPSLAKMNANADTSVAASSSSSTSSPSGAGAGAAASSSSASAGSSGSVSSKSIKSKGKKYKPPSNLRRTQSDSSLGSEKK